MDPQLYKLLHLVALVLLFMGLTLLLTGAKGFNRMLGGIFHGIGLLIMLVAGFGMIAKLNYGFKGWVIAKIVIWVLLGALPMLTKKKNFPPRFTLLFALACGALAVYLAIYKPF